MKAGAASKARPATADPTVAIIVTNYNYGHFLEGCLASVLAQTVRPDEIIVVDDGSTDGSAAVLDRYRTRVKVIRKPNGGQASAFNIGFAQATSDLVIFLDADDLLRPEALETVLTWWRPGLASLAYWLELIDVAGHSRGLYEETLRIDEGDKRQRLITRGVFAFAPTSGNVFSRPFLESFLPLDETRWRISADLPLTYAAGLSGPTVVIPQALGAYRTHGSNNYYRERLPSVWRLHRGMRDVVDALAYLADRPPRGGPPLDAGPLTLALRGASLRMRVKLLALEGNRGDVARHAWRELRKILTATLPWNLRLHAALPFCVVVLGGWRSGRLRQWVADPRTRPSIISWLSRRLRGRHTADLAARIATLQRPRWPVAMPFDVSLGPDFNGPFAGMMAEGWSGEMSDTLHWTSGAEAALEFRVDPQPHGVRLDLVLAIAPAFKAATVLIETLVGERRLTIDRITGEGAIAVDLAREMVEAGPVVRLRLICRVIEPAGPLWRRLRAPEPTFAIRAYRLKPLRLPPSFPLLAPGCSYPMSQVLPPEAADPEWQIDTDGVAWMLQPEATCRITVAPHAEPVGLTFTVAPSDAPGWLRIGCGEATLFTGQVTPGARLQCELRPMADPEATGLDLSFAFAATDPTDPGPFGLAAIGLVNLRDTTKPAEPRTEPTLRLNPGERVDLGTAAGRGFETGKNWSFDELSGLSNLDTEASFGIALPVDCHDRVLHLAMEPLIPRPEDHHHLVAISSNHQVLVSARLEGPGDLDVAVPPTLGPDGTLKLTLHSIFVAEASGHDNPTPPLFAGVGLRAISLSARPATPQAPAPPRPPIWSGSALHRFGPPLRDALSGGGTGDGAALHRLREALATTLWATDGRALESHLMDPGFLDDIERLGALARRLPLSAAEQALLRRIEAAPMSADLLVPRMLALMALRVAPPAPALLDLGAIPPPLLWSVSPLARFLAGICDEGGIAPAPTPRETAAAGLLTGVLAVLRKEARDMARYRLAVGVLERLKPCNGAAAPAGPDAIAVLWARGVELHLARSGCMIAAAPRPAGRMPLRIGLFVRDTRPGEGMGRALALAVGLDRECFMPVLVTLSRPAAQIDGIAGFEQVLDLMGGTPEQGVARIRALDLDAIVIASRLDRMDGFAAIAAHRLAPVQHLLAPAGWGTGLRSVAARLDGEHPSPACDAFAALRPEPALDHDVVRKPLSTFRRHDPAEAAKPPAGRAVLAASERDLLGCPGVGPLWVRILAGASRSDLVITAASVADPAPGERSLPGLLALWCRDLGVAEDRITIVDGMPPAEDAAWPAEVDLYLGALGGDAGDLALPIGVALPFVAYAGPEASASGAEVWASCLFAAGLVARTAEDYVQSAIGLVDDPAALRERGQAIATALAAATLDVDSARVTALGTALRTAVGLRPRDPDAV